MGQQGSGYGSFFLLGHGVGASASPQGPCLHFQIFCNAFEGRGNRTDRSSPRLASTLDNALVFRLV
jgi:hypothetical protein